MDRIIQRIVEGFVNKGIVDCEEKSIYEFGLRQGFVIIINFVTMFTIGLVFGELLNVLVFAISYLVLRPYAGGYHAETEVGCYVLSNLLILAVILISRNAVFDFSSLIIMLCVACGVLLFLSPVEDHRKPLDDVEIEVFRRTLRLRLSIEILIGLIGIYYFKNLFIFMVLAVVAVAFMSFFGWIKNMASSDLAS